MVREALNALEPHPDRLVLAAVSGGADSLALAVALAFVAPRLGVRAGAVVIDHGLQDESREVATWAAHACRELGLSPVDVVAVQVDQRGDGPESAARRARHQALAEHRQRTGASHVLLAHTRDDQAEQVLLGLLRGSGARSLSGMSPVAGSLLHPFLDISRAETESSCAAAGITPWRDPHNDDRRFTRVRTRQLLTSLEEQVGPVKDNLARTARLLRDDGAALDSWARQVADAAEGGSRIEVAALKDLPRAVRTRVLRLLVLRSGAEASTLGFRHLDELDRLVTNWHGQGPIDLPGGLEVRRREGALVVGPRRPVE